MSALAEARALFDLRADILLPVDLENGDGPGFRALCPVDRRVVTVRPNEGDFNVVFRCESGCAHSRIADKLNELTSTPGGFASDDLKADDCSGVAESWQPVTLLSYLAADREPDSPLLLARSDGPALLYAGRLHAISAEPESGKGWLALTACVEAIEEKQRPAIYVDLEDTPESIAARMLALGVNFEAIRDRFHYVRPDEPVTTAAVDALVALNPALVVIDGVTEALAIEGLDMANNQDVAEFYKRLARPFARAGAAVLLVDHVVKDKDARGRYAIGAQHKLAGVDVAYRLDVAQPFGRGREGLVKITVTKDRPGHVRQHAADRERIAMMRLTSAAGHVTVALEPPEGAGAAFRPTRLMERISKAVAESPGLSIRGLREAVKGNNEAKALALELLVNEGFIDARRDGQAVKHYPLCAYREADDVPTVPNRAQPVPGAHVPTVPPPLQGGTGQRTANGHATVPIPLATPEEEALISRLEAA